MYDPSSACLALHPVFVGSKVGRDCAVAVSSSRLRRRSKSILHPGAYALMRGVFDRSPTSPSAALAAGDTLSKRTAGCSMLAFGT